MDFEKLKKEYDEKGIVIIPSVFTPEECDEIKRQSYQTSDQQIQGTGYPHMPSQHNGKKRLMMFFPALANEYLNKIRTDERMVNIVKSFIGDDVRQINNQIYFRESGDNDQFAWHQDIIFRENGNFNSDVVDDYLQTIVVVDDINEDNGAIEFIDGSHKTMKIDEPSNLRTFDRNGLSGKKYTAKKGDVMIWSVMIVHGSEPNNSSSDRMTYMNGFCRTKATKTYPDYLVGGNVVDKIDVNKIPR